MNSTKLTCKNVIILKPRYGYLRSNISVEGAKTNKIVCYIQRLLYKSYGPANKRCHHLYSHIMNGKKSKKQHSKKQGGGDKSDGKKG